MTFTVPREIGSVLRGCQREGYHSFFDSSGQSIYDVGFQLGFFGILHTWGRDPMAYHPHIHYVVPGGGVNLDAHGRPESWLSMPKNFLFDHGTLVRLYKAKLADERRACGLYASVPSLAWEKPLVVDIQPDDYDVPTLNYLAPYVHRVAISDKRTVAVGKTSVTYSMRSSS